MPEGYGSDGAPGDVANHGVFRKFMNRIFDEYGIEHPRAVRRRFHGSELCEVQRWFNARPQLFPSFVRFCRAKCLIRQKNDRHNASKKRGILAEENVDRSIKMRLRSGMDASAWKAAVANLRRTFVYRGRIDRDVRRAAFEARKRICKAAAAVSPLSPEATQKYLRTTARAAAAAAGAAAAAAPDAMSISSDSSE